MSPVNRTIILEYVLYGLVRARQHRVNPFLDPVVANPAIPYLYRDRGAQMRIRFAYQRRRRLCRFSFQAIKAGVLVFQKSRVIMIAEVIHQAQVAPITNGSRNVR
jgi:hypothetical protein